MELKFYLRGLGLGIVVTALIMGIASSKNQTMTDAEIIARAKQLGMIEDTVLKEKTSDEDDDSEEITSGNVNDLQAETQEPNQSVQTEADDAGAESDAEGVLQNADTDVEDILPDADTDAEDVMSDANVDMENTGSNGDREDSENRESDAGTADAGTDGAEPETERNSSGASVVITIGNGDGSYSASKKLAEAGVVSSAESFDNFLCENGYDKKIRAGTYTIPADASDEQMARIITGVE